MRPPPDTPRWFERHPKKTLAAVVAGGLVLLVLADVLFAQLYYARTGHAWADRAVVAAWHRHQRYRTAATPYHHDLRPNVSVPDAEWEHRTYPLATNALGFIDAAPRAVERERAQPRILLVGDSFTEGVGVAYGDTFAGRMAAALAPEGVEVLNSAVASYAPVIHRRKLRYLLEEVGLRFDEVIVFLDVADVSDEVNRYQRGPEGDVIDRPRPAPSVGKPAWLRRHTALIYAAGRALHMLVRPRNGQLDQRSAQWALDSQAYAREGREGQALMAQHMDAVVALLRARDIDLTVAVYPWPDLVMHGDTASVHRTFWRAWAARHGVAFLDLFPAFRPPKGTAPMSVVESLFIRGDVHWNEAGHRRVADALLDFRKNRRSPPPLTSDQ